MRDCESLWWIVGMVFVVGLTIFAGYKLAMYSQNSCTEDCQRIYGPEDNRDLKGCIHGCVFRARR